MEDSGLRYLALFSLLMSGMRIGLAIYLLKLKNYLGA
jgi:hypothetical protein